MKTKQKIKYPKIKVNKELNKYTNVELFPEKVRIANERLKRTGIPKMDDSK
jgi:hypothetical protein